ncbi:MAG TPA: hypothetical protein VGI39_01310 [Polyangiaceae bacterium]|jgi:hypothetical protein
MAAALSLAPIVKACRCGRAYSAETWSALKYVGTSRYPWGEVQELRDCPCGSTIARVLEEGLPESGPCPHCGRELGDIEDRDLAPHVMGACRELGRK